MRPNGRGGAERGCLQTAAAQGTGPSGRGKRGETGWMAKPSLSQQPQGSKESKRPSVHLGRLCPFPPDWCYLGLTRSCLKTSVSGELSEGAGGRNRYVHMLKLWLECLEPLAGPQAQGTWRERGPPQNGFLPDLGAQCAPAGTAGQSACKQAFGSSRGSLQVGECSFCSEATQSKGKTQHSPCPWRTWRRSSWSPLVLPHEGEGCWMCVQTCPCPSQAQPR